MLPAPPHRICSHLANTSRASLARASLPYSNAAVGITGTLLRHGLVSNLTLGTPSEPNPAAFPTTPKPAQRLWVELKHRNGEPVLRRINLVSKASLRKFVDNKELGRILRGSRARNVQGVGTGEIIVLKVAADSAVDRKGAATYMEGWEAFQKGLGGEVVCRAS
jgi:ribosomal protein S8